MPRMSIETLIAAAEYIERHDKKRLASPPPQPQPRAPPPPPPPPPQQPQALTLPLPHGPAGGVLLQQVLQQAQPAQAVPIQHVTIQHAPANGRIIAAAQPLGAIRIQPQKKGAALALAEAPAAVVPSATNPLAVKNSFDLLNPAVIDQVSGEVKRKQPPMAFRTGTREVHNKLEKDRRAHLKDCFDALNATLPSQRDAGKKTSNLNILDSALRCITYLKDEDAGATRLRDELEGKKLQLQQRYTELKKDVERMHKIDVPDVLTFDAGGRKRRHHDDKLPKVAIARSDAAPPHAGTAAAAAATTQHSATPPPPPPPPPAVAATAAATVVGSMLKLPKSITATTKDEGGAAFAFTGYPIPAANGGLVLVPQALGGGADHHHHHQLTAQFVSTHHHHHHHHHHLPAAPADAKVIVNAQYVVKPLVVVSTASRPS